MSWMDGGFAPFLGLWVITSAAMMLPSILPAASLAAHVGSSVPAFVGGYLFVWSATGAAAFEVVSSLDSAPAILVPVALAAAAAYQVTPIKHACLRRCRSPLGLLLRRGPLRAGIEHGAFCLGCCWALMLTLLVIGAGSLAWMAVVAGAIFVEKALLGSRATIPLALALVALAVWTAL
jgi:predicted metal-binding membrane protein